MEEVWKDIKGYENLYKVSNLGRIKSLRRLVPLKNGFRRIKERILKQTANNKGYCVVSLNKSGDCNTFMIHSLVSIHFLNHKPNGRSGLVIDHIDNNPQNNKLSNLQIISHRENCSKDKYGYTSRYIGVSRYKDRWRAAIGYDGKMNHIGYFKSEYYAHLAYQNELSKLKTN